MNATASAQHKVAISVVIPVFNEQENLEPLIVELEEELNRLSLQYEIVCVDDRSTDQSLQKLQALQQGHRYLRVIRHSVNSGESAGQATGFAFSQGDVIITMDADQQNDPADIPALLKALHSDIAAVCGVRRIREDDWIRRLSSKIANCFRNAITGDQITDAGCTFRALRRSALRELPVFNGLHRFLPTILRLQGYRVVEIAVNHRQRTRGTSKYGVGNRLFRGILDCIAMRWFRRRCLRGDRVVSP
ncbi:MAG: glycosyltransferase family 2 protein [Proteobacteria bacterium]|nr:glycosyltransferase family 2 protein [Pseudomonadota bacterium]